jgi:SSS family solute:Na+ symporter
MAQNQLLFLAIFIVYLLVMVAISWAVSRSQKSSNDFLLAGRKVPFLLTVGTTVATMVGTGSSMGAVGFAYQNAWAGSLYGVGGALGILLLAWLFAPARDKGFSTMSEELASYVNNQRLVKRCLALIIYAASIGWLGAHLIGGAMYLAWLTGIDTFSAKLIIGVGLAIYVTLGGYSAVIWTDAIQAIMLFVGFILMAYFAVDLLGGVAPLVTSERAVNSGLFSVNNIGVVPAISLALVVMVGVLATPSFRQRIYSGCSVSSIRKSFVTSGMLYLAFSLIPAVIGISAFLINNGLENPAYAFPYLALNALPVVLGGLIILAGISATLSSASSDAIAGVSVLVSDIYTWLFKKPVPIKHQLLYSRIAILMTVGIALVLALLSNDLISYITKMIATLMSGLCVIGLLGRFWHGFTWQGALASLCVSFVVSLVISQMETLNAALGNPIIPALVCACVAGVLVSLVTNKASSTTEHPSSNAARQVGQV